MPMIMHIDPTIDNAPEKWGTIDSIRTCDALNRLLIIARFVANAYISDNSSSVLFELSFWVDWCLVPAAADARCDSSSILGFSNKARYIQLAVRTRAGSTATPQLRNGREWREWEANYIIKVSCASYFYFFYFYVFDKKHKFFPSS